MSNCDYHNMDSSSYVETVILQAFYPLLSNLYECCLSIPISSALPERGASALKCNKTRLQPRLQKWHAAGTYEGFNQWATTIVHEPNLKRGLEIEFRSTPQET